MIRDKDLRENIFQLIFMRKTNPAYSAAPLTNSQLYHELIAWVIFMIHYYESCKVSLVYKCQFREILRKTCVFQYFDCDMSSLLRILWSCLKMKNIQSIFSKK